MLNRIFFLRSQFILALLIFVAVFALGTQHAFGNELEEIEDAEVATPVRPVMGNWAGVPANNTNLGPRWNRVASSGISQSHTWRELSAYRSNPLLLVEKANDWVNSHVEYKADADDEWQPVGVTVTRGRGDCDDFAIAKYQILKSLGIPERDLYYVIVRDLAVHQVHAFLLVRVGTKYFILDNLDGGFAKGFIEVTPKLIDSVFFPMSAYSGSNGWMFGRLKSQ